MFMSFIFTRVLSSRCVCAQLQMRKPRLGLRNMAKLIADSHVPVPLPQGVLLLFPSHLSQTGPKGGQGQGRDLHY